MRTGESGYTLDVPPVATNELLFSRGRDPREDLARQYLRWVRITVSVVAAAALFAIWLAYRDDGILRAAMVGLLSSLLGVWMLFAARTFGHQRVVRASAYVDIVVISFFVAQFQGVGVYGVTFLWAIVIAAAFGTPADTVTATIACVALTYVLPHATGNPDAAQVAVEALMLGVVGTMVAALSFDVHRSGRERRSLERQLQDAQRIAQVGSFDFNVTTDEARWSEEMYRIFGVVGGVALGRAAFMDAIVPEDRERVGAALEAGTKGENVAFDCTIRRGDGELRQVHVIGSTVMRDDGPRVVGTVQDITSLRELDAMRDDFVAAASHELRTPTSIVLGFATTLASEWDRLSDHDHRRFVGEIERAALRLSVLIEDVLQVSQIESGNLRCSHDPFDVRDVVAEVVRTWPGELVIELAEGDGDAPVIAMGDPVRSRQVLANLLENAERHADAGPVQVELEQYDGHVRVRVRDHGPGIPREAHERIFDRFVRLGHDSTGTGLGLFISRGLAEAQGGSLDVDSAPGHGATFTFELLGAPKDVSRAGRPSSPPG